MVQFLHPGRLMGSPRIVSGEAPAPDYSAEADALFAAMSTQPSDAVKEAYDDFYVGFLAAGFVLSQFRMYYCGHDAQAASLELGNPGTNSLTTNGTVTFTAHTSWQSNGTDGYLSTGIAANAFQPKSLIVASQDTGTISGMAIGATTDNTCAMQTRNGSGNAFLKIANATQLAVANSDGAGVTIGTKTAGNQLRVIRNGVSLGTGASGADSFGSETLVILRAGTFTTRRVAFAGFANFPVTVGEAGTLSTLIQSLCNTINPGLIP